jgi:predicted TIM-barrel fold metal-dependent hydrolase
MGLPDSAGEAVTPARATDLLADVLALACYPGIHVKLSGFYALTKPGYAYPHEPAWHYVEALLNRFSASRLLWGSDFSPSLEHVSYPQTLFVLEQIPFLSAADRAAIEGANLLRLLESVHTDSPHSKP